MSLSTLESEYSAFSQAMRQFLLLRRLILELTATLDMGNTLKSSIKCIIFENNDLALLPMICKKMYT